MRLALTAGVPIINDDAVNLDMANAHAAVTRNRDLDLEVKLAAGWYHHRTFFVQFDHVNMNEYF